MADFATWATACEAAFWDDGTFENAYAGNREEAIDSVVEADPVGSAILSLMRTRTQWTGTASKLLAALSEVRGGRDAKADTWPQNAQVLSRKLRRLETFLRKRGIEVNYEKEGRERTRIIRILREAENEETIASVPSAAGNDPPGAPGNEDRFGEWWEDPYSGLERIG